MRRETQFHGTLSGETDTFGRPMEMLFPVCYTETNSCLCCVEMSGREKKGWRGMKGCLFGGDKNCFYVSGEGLRKRAASFFDLQRFADVITRTCVSGTALSLTMEDLAAVPDDGECRLVDESGVAYARLVKDPAMQR